MGCPIRILRAHRLYAAPPERFAGLRVLLRHSAPRHPPRTLCSLFSICYVSSVMVFLCFNSCIKSLSKIEDSSYSVVHVPLPGDNLRVPNNSRVENSLFVFIVRVSDRPGIELTSSSSSLERR